MLMNDPQKKDKKVHPLHLVRDINTLRCLFSFIITAGSSFSGETLSTLPTLRFQARNIFSGPLK